jgi:GNAT superfamily N-acetyltransferase
MARVEEIPSHRSGNVRILEIQSLGFATDLLVRRAAGSEIRDRGRYLVVRTQENPTYYWGNFILVPPSIPVDEALKLFADEFPSASHVALGIDGSSGQAMGVSGLVESGFELEISCVLRHVGPPAGGDVDGLPIHGLESDDDWAQLATLRSAIALRDGRLTPGYEIYLDHRLEEARRLDPERAVHLGAFIDGQLRSSLGVVSDDRGMARYQSVETHPDFRRRGLAGALVVAGGKHAAAAFGAHTLVIVADPDGPPVNLYRSLGFSDAERQVQLTLRS